MPRRTGRGIRAWLLLVEGKPYTRGRCIERPERGPARDGGTDG